jgi:hypothetical protein
VRVAVLPRAAEAQTAVPILVRAPAQVTELVEQS